MKIFRLLTLTLITLALTASSILAQAAPVSNSPVITVNGAPLYEVEVRQLGPQDHLYVVGPHAEGADSGLAHGRESRYE